MDNAAAHHTGSVAAKAHAHGQRLFAAGVGFLETVVQIEGNARKVAKILQQSKQREEDCHRGQHDRNDPRQHPPNAQHQTVVQPFWRVQQAEQVAQSLLYPKQRICQ